MSHSTISPLQFRLFLFTRLPLAFIAGLRLVALSDTQATIGIRHRWINQNPFRSMYFAAQAMAAELSAGVLCLAKIRASGRSVSMLVTHSQCEFVRKATGKIRFDCEQGEAVDIALEQTLSTGEPRTVNLASIGTDEQGEAVSRFEFTWSIKARS